MPATNQKLLPLNAHRIFNLRTHNIVSTDKNIQLTGNKQFTRYRIQPSPNPKSSTLRDVNITMDHIEEILSRRHMRVLIPILFTLLMLIITAIVGTAIVVPLVLRERSSATTTSSSGPSIQYSFAVTNSVQSNMSPIFDTTHSTYTNSTY